jgi:lysophospholipase L1-like esterase
MSALTRFDRDVLAVPGTRYLIVFEGVNDLGGLDRTEDHPQNAHDALVAAMEDGYRQMVIRAHEHGILVYGGTITPYGGSGYYHPTPQSEGDRLALNAWIRTSGVFDGVIDFDTAVRDANNPDRLDKAAGSQDNLHPGPAGYKRMGEAISLNLFQK